MARPAFSAENEIAQQRNVVAWRDRRVTVWTMRRRMYDRFVARQPRDAHVQEAAKGKPQQHDEDSDGQVEDQHRA